MTPDTLGFCVSCEWRHIHQDKLDNCIRWGHVVDLPTGRVGEMTADDQVYLFHKYTRCDRCGTYGHMIQATMERRVEYMGRTVILRPLFMCYPHHPLRDQIMNPYGRPWVAADSHSLEEAKR